MKRDKKPPAEPAFNDADQSTAAADAADANDASPPPSHNQCGICSKVFAYGNDLRKHLRIHSDERPFPCPECGQRFRQAGCLKNHIASQHGGAASFSCHYCAKTFPIKERLRLHMRIHSGEKPYKCAKCARSFSRGGQVGKSTALPLPFGSSYPSKHTHTHIAFVSAAEAAHDHAPRLPVQLFGAAADARPRCSIRQADAEQPVEMCVLR